MSMPHSAGWQQEIGNQKIDVCVGTGGSIESIGELRKDLFDKNSAQKVTAEELKALVKKLRTMTFEERIQQLRLRPDRADVIVPAAIVLQKIVQQAGVEEVIIPGIGLKDGVLLEIIAEIRDQEKQFYRDQVIESARRLGKKYFFDEKHAHGRLETGPADLRSDETRSMSWMTKPGLILEVAALLHDIGHYVNVANHHKHTFLSDSVESADRIDLACRWIWSPMSPATTGSLRPRCSTNLTKISHRSSGSSFQNWPQFFGWPTRWITNMLQPSIVSRSSTNGRGSCSG